MKKFAIVNRYAPQKPVGYLEYDEKKESFHVRIAPDVHPNDLPFIMMLFAKRGIYDMTPEWSIRWVRDRIVPPGRQNIGQILKNHGLKHYDEMTIIESTKGRCAQDDFEIVPASEKANIRNCTISPVKQFAPVEIRSIRNRCNLSQQCFAKCLGVTTKAVEAWESGRTTPNGAACRLLEMAQKNPRFFSEIGIVKE